MSKVVWITASPRNPATGAVVTVRLAGGGNVLPYYRDHHYRAGVANQPRFSAELGFDRNGWTGGTVPATGNLVFRPAQSALLDELAGYHWRDAAITVESGPEGGPYSAVLTGVVADAPIADFAMTIVIADLSFAIDKPVAIARFAGNGGAEGGSEAAGRVKRRSWGRVFNIEGRVLDKATSVYEFGDPAFPWQQFDAVRDIGRAAAPAPAVLGWQGSIAGTLTALKASAPADGSGVVAPSIACAKWWTQPVGPLTADVRGEIGTGYVETAPEIAARIVAAVAGPAIANVSAMAAIRAGAAGLHVGDENETASQALDRLLLGVSLLWILEPAGTIRLREWTFAAPVETLVSHKVTRLRSFAPVKSRRLGYQRSHRIHSDGEIAATLLGLDPAAGAKLGGIAEGATKNRVFRQAGDPADEPLNGVVNGDEWVDTDVTPNVHRVRVAGAWAAAANLTTEGSHVGVENGADVTATAQHVVEVPPARSYPADYLGAVTSGLPDTITPKVTKGGVSVRTLNSTSYAVVGTNCTVAVDNVNGNATKGNVTVSALAAKTCHFELTVTINGVAMPPVRTVLLKDEGSPPTPSGGGGGSTKKSDNTSSFNAITATSGAPAALTVASMNGIVVATGEKLYGTAPLDYQTAAAGNFAHGRSGSVRWEYAPTGSTTWSSFGAFVTGSVSTKEFETAGEYYPAEPGHVDAIQNVNPGAGTYDVRLVAYQSSSANSSSLSFWGTATIEAKV